MIRHLLRNTALVSTLVLAGGVASAQAAEKINLTLGGYANYALGFDLSESDGADNATGHNGGEKRVKYLLENEFEIHFVGSTKLENGIEVGFRFELENPTGGTTNARKDDTYAWFAGNFGRVEVGETTDPGYTRAYAAPNASGLFGADDATFGFTNIGQTGTPGGGIAGTALPTTRLIIADTDDATKIKYVSPRIAGVEAQISWTPDATTEHHGDGTGFRNVGVNGTTNNIWTMALDYTGDVGPVTLGLAGVYSFGDSGDTRDRITSPRTYGVDPYVYTFGANVAYAGFTVGGGYGFGNAGPWGYSTGRVGVNAAQTEAVSAGAKYAFGPAAVGLSWIQMSWDAGRNAVTGNTATVKQDTIALDATYGFAPGISFSAGIQYYAGEFSTGNAAAPQSDYDNIGAGVGVSLTF